MRLSENDYIHGGTQKDFYESSETEYTNCPLCDNNSYNKIDDDKGLSIVKCNSCKLIYTNPRAIESEKNYFGDETLFYNEARLIFLGKKTHHRDPNYENELSHIKRIKKSGRLLDIGTNMGFFLKKALEYGYDGEGIEPSPSLAKIAKEQLSLKIHNGFIQDFNLPEKGFDIITMIDVFEHIGNPKVMLKELRKLLKDDGILTIKVPNGNYNFLKMKLSSLLGRKANMDIWDLSEHVVHYSPKTFKKIIETEEFKIKRLIIPKPVNPPVWAEFTGHYFQHPSPFILDWKRIILRKLFYYIGKTEKLFTNSIKFAPDLMFIIEKK